MGNNAFAQAFQDEAERLLADLNLPQANLNEIDCAIYKETRFIKDLAEEDSELQRSEATLKRELENLLEENRLLEQELLGLIYQQERMAKL